MAVQSLLLVLGMLRGCLWIIAGLGEERVGGEEVPSSRHADWRGDMKGSERLPPGCRVMKLAGDAEADPLGRRPHVDLLKPSTLKSEQDRCC